MELLIKHNEIVDMCEKIGLELQNKFAGKNPLIVAVLKGACPFHCELIKHIDLPLEVTTLKSIAILVQKAQEK